ncbi:MAG: SWIM zinc finger family protein [Methanosarcinales archaeon]
MSRRDYFWGGYTPSTPIEVEGGIKAKSKRGNIGDTWWSKRWVYVLESFGWTNRLERGRRYARKGQVLEYTLFPGKVKAKTQGSVKKPYSVTIEITPFSEDEWDSVIKEMSKKAVFAAKLLAGEMPLDIEEAFNAAGVSLFPTSSRNIRTNCSCPDSANPCKHIAAVYYILAEEFDRDPFMLFTLRGRTQKEITGLLRKKRTLSKADIPDTQVHAPEKKGNGNDTYKLSVENFWIDSEPESFCVDISPPDVSAAIIKRLGPPQFWDNRRDFNKMMGKYYDEISKHAVETAYGDPSGLREKKKRMN